MTTRLGVPDITRILNACSAESTQSGTDVLPFVYKELRRLAAAKLASEKPGATLQPTALVHEAWLRIMEGDAERRFADRTHFFAVAAEAMRRILIDRARRKLAAKNGGGAEHLPLDACEIALPTDQEEELLAIHEALDRLAAHDARKAEVVKLRYFAGFALEDVADVLGISLPTAKRDWTYARAWLFRALAVDRRWKEPIPPRS